MESWLREGRRGSTAGAMRGPHVIWEGTDIGPKAGLQLAIVVVGGAMARWTDQRKRRAVGWAGTV